MSYVIPEGIQTRDKAVLAVASVIADEDKGALGDGSVNTALDVLADVLAGQNVEVPQTNAGAILALADYVGGGGGAQSYPITVNVTGGTVKFYTDSGDEFTASEAPAGTLLTLLPKTPGGDTPTSGSINAYATQSENTPSFIDATDFSHDFAVAMPIGGLTVSVTIRE